VDSGDGDGRARRFGGALRCSAAPSGCRAGARSVLRAVLGGVRFGADKTARGAGFRCLLLGRQPAWNEPRSVGSARACKWLLDMVC
jgi:hypothetical protein